MEIERKWLMDGFPDAQSLPLLRHSLVRQGYVSTAPVVRIRESILDGVSRYVLCFKGKGTLAREEVEQEISAEFFNKLKVFTGEDLVSKDFKEYALPNGLKLEVSHVDAARDTAFYYAEVEFESIEAANAFVPPAFLGKEMTEDAAFSMNRYWQQPRGDTLCK